ncbi:MAG: CotH kinase family protein [Anaerolineae bacterium]
MNTLKNLSRQILLSLFIIFILSACTTAATNETIQTENTENSVASSPSVDSSVEIPEVIISESVQETAVGEELEIVDSVEIDSEVSEVEEELIRPVGWSDETHSKSAEPNYDVVFPYDSVNRIDIVIDPSDWELMLADLTAILGEQGSGAAGGGNGGGDRPPRGGGGDRPPRGAGGAGAGEGDFTETNPIWVSGTIQFEGKIWTNVGVRFKGNSTLRNAWNNGSQSLPFKLDFDEFEDEFPEIDNQRFYGFKQLSLSNNLNDSSLMRDTITADLMQEAGIAAAETASYTLYVDYGEGPVNLGIYTVIEVIDDTVVERVFGDDSGNIYEADGPSASLAVGTLEGLAETFEKENNADEADWSDLEALYAVLHSDSRLSDPEAWKAELESIFDVDLFLHWLAINSVIENWDTYGAMTHNFYLYNNPDNGLLTWIPWDHNESLASSRRGNMTLDMNNIGAEWPLISFLLDDSEYRQIYVDYVDDTINTVFEPESMTATYTAREAIISQSLDANGSADLERAVEDLIAHTNERIRVAEAFLAQSDSWVAGQ